MKKLLFMIGLGIFSTLCSNEVSAFRFLGSALEFKKGTPEWNATKTHRMC
ncbi:MAG: hypothetical protein IPQ18_15060 [Saprospiraceae bacterium]|nr:hypothetical protein [Saprospiraceae bacterium]